MGDLGGGEFARLRQGMYKIANLVEGVDGDINLDGIARQPRDPVRGLEEENPFGRGQPVEAVVVDPVGQMVGMVVDLPVLDLDGPQVLADRLACRFPYRSFRTWHGRDPLGFVVPCTPHGCHSQGECNNAWQSQWSPPDCATLALRPHSPWASQ